MPWRCSERVRGQAFNDPDKQRKNLVSVVAVVVVVQVKKFGLQHSITVRVWDDSGKEHSRVTSRTISSKFIHLSKSGRWQAPAAVLPEGPKNIGDSHSRARRAREWPKHASPRARRARG